MLLFALTCSPSPIHHVQGVRGLFAEVQDHTTTCPPDAKVRVNTEPSFLTAPLGLDKQHEDRKTARSATEPEILFDRYNVKRTSDFGVSLGAGPRLALTKFKSYTALLPTAFAVAKLEDFYDTIALKIETGQFAHWPPSKNRILEMWDFELHFTCDKTTIP